MQEPQTCCGRWAILGGSGCWITEGSQHDQQSQIQEVWWQEGQTDMAMVETKGRRGLCASQTYRKCVGDLQPGGRSPGDQITKYTNP